MENLLYWIWLALICENRPALGERVLAYFDGDPQEAFFAGAGEMERAVGKRQLGLFFDERPLSDGARLDEPKRIAELCVQKGYGILPQGSEYYPPALQKIREKPVLLYYRGRRPDAPEQSCVAMVGTRDMTDYGHRLGYEIAYDLAREGLTIVSGLALGVDSICHRAALDAGGYTIAVTGCGLDRVYPSKNRELYEEIAARGTVLTEYHPGVRPNAYNFPRRNRIISGLCRDTLVVEASGRSGSLITAECAIKQGRNLLAIPGNAGEQSSAGTNELLQRGAKLVTSAQDVLRQRDPDAYARREKELRREAARREKEASEARAKQKTPGRREDITANAAAFVSGLDTSPAFARPKEEPVRQQTPPSPPVSAARPEIEDAALRALYDRLPDGAFSLDQVAGADAETLGGLTMLELCGAVESLPGGKYRKS